MMPLRSNSIAHLEQQEGLLSSPQKLLHTPGPLYGFFCVPHRTHDFTAPAGKKSCSEEFDSVARKSLLN